MFVLGANIYSFYQHAHLILNNVTMTMHIISTDEDPSLRIESFAAVNLRGVSTKLYLHLTASSAGVFCVKHKVVDFITQQYAN